MQRTDQELLPGRRHAGRLGLHLVSSPHLSLGLGTDKRGACLARRGDTALLVPGCRALSLVPWGISVPSTCPRPDSRTKALNIDRCQSLIRLSLLTRTAWTRPACSLCSRLLSTHWERWPFPRTLPTSSTWQGGLLLQPPSNCLCPSSRGGPGHQQFQAGSAVSWPSGQWQHGQCPLTTEWWKEGDRLGVPGPQEREEGEDAGL